MSTSATPTTTFAMQWEKVCTFLHSHYYKPDTEGLLITLATYRAHFWLSDPPIWLAIIGPPGSGKTEIACGALEALPKVQAESSLTVNSFLSGTGEKMGILPHLKDQNGIISFPDFTTTILSIEPNKRVEISGQLRRIADGSYEKSVGNQEKQLRWRGKVTCIAAGTQDIESFFDENRDKGDRWVYLRWRAFNDSTADKLEYARKARASIGHKAKIRDEYHRLIYSLMKIGSGGGAKDKEIVIPTDAHTDQLDNLAVLLEVLRTSVKREFSYRKGMVISDIGNTQMPTRTPQNFISIARASCALRSDNEIKDCDLALARRVALDSIPTRRRKLIDILLTFRKEIVTKSELAMSIGMSRSAFDLVLGDLRALGIVTIIPGEPDPALELIPNESDGLDGNNPYVHRFAKAKDGVVFSEHILSLLARSGL